MLNYVGDKSPLIYNAPPATVRQHNNDSSHYIMYTFNLDVIGLNRRNLEFNNIN